MQRGRMTAKQAITARCRDCLAGNRECAFTGCALKGLAKAKGKVSKKALVAYCRRCLNGHLFTVCNSPDCAVYQCRNGREGSRENTPNLPENRGYRGGLSPSITKKVSKYH
jgi:hypothetical protein